MYNLIILKKNGDYKMFSMVCNNSEYGWFVFVCDDCRSIYRLFSCDSMEQAFGLGDILRAGCDVAFPLFMSGMHFKEVYALTDV